METRILRLTLKKKWFDMILAGIKTEEYREMKSFWISRLIEFDFAWASQTIEDAKEHLRACPNGFFKKFDFIEFSNGYGNKVPKMIIEFKGVEIREGNPDWGAVKGIEYFVINLGKITDTKNTKNPTE